MSRRCPLRPTLCLTKGLYLTRHCIATTSPALASLTLSLISLPRRANFTVAAASQSCIYGSKGTFSASLRSSDCKKRFQSSQLSRTSRHTASHYTHSRSSYSISPGSTTNVLQQQTRNTNLNLTMSTTMTQTRTHSGGHGHHHHHHDTTFLTSTNKNDAGVRITKVGLYVNLAMAIGKGVGGYVFHSQALSADAVHSATDLVSDFMTLATVSWALRPPTKQYPLGFGKIESLGSLGVSGLLLIGGLWMGWSSLLELIMIYLPAWTQTLENLGMIGCSHGHHHSIPNIQAAWLAGGSVLVKEWLYRATMKVAIERKSAVLKSNAVHHRVDSLTGIAALLSIAISNIFPSFAGMDAVGGLVISYMVIRAGWGNTLTSLQELADATISDEIRDKTQSVASRAVQDCGLAGSLVKGVSGTKAGQNYLLDITVAVLPKTDVQELTSIEKVIRDRVAAGVRGARRVRIRFVQSGNAYDPMDEFVTSQDSGFSTPESEEHTHHVHGPGHTTGVANGNNANGSAVRRR